MIRLDVSRVHLHFPTAFTPAGAAMLLTLGLPFVACGGDSSTASEDGGAPDGATAADSSGSVCAVDADCGDGVYCNGVETCRDGDPRADSAGCVPGTPVDCDDGVTCTQDQCSEELRTCVHSPPDVDGDGHGDVACLDSDGVPVGDDCDDNDSNRFPGNTEVCNGGDEDCNPETLGFVDADMDGAGSAACCNPQADGSILCGPDCADADGSIRPGIADGPESNCDNIDNDCDGAADEGCPCVTGTSVPCGPDPIGECRRGEQFCFDGSLSDTCVDAVYPAEEFCDGLDQDCDGTADNGVKRTYYRDGDSDGFGTLDETAEACSPPAGFTSALTDCDDMSPAVNPAAIEFCDGLDNNCANGVDEGCECTNGETRDCGPSTDAGECEFGVQRCVDGVWIECAGATLPEPESCNGRDDDCDTEIDNGVLRTFFADADGDGFGDITSSIEACSPPSGYVSNDADCRDTNPALHPAAFEACDGIDNNCDGSTDPGCACTDGQSLSCGPTSDDGICTFGSQLCIGGQWTACAGAVMPQAEACNGIDDDCDGNVDNGFPCAKNESQACTNGCGVTGGSQSCLEDCSGFSACRADEQCNGCDDDLDDDVDETFACAAGEPVTCTNACGTLTQVTCTNSCAVPTCVSPSEICNYCDDDGDPLTTDQPLATGAEVFTSSCSDYDFYGNAACTNLVGKAGAAMLDGTLWQTAGGWLKNSRYLGWGPITAHVTMEVRNAAGSARPADGWTVILADGGSGFLGTGGINRGTPTTRTGISVEWSFFSNTTTEEPDRVNVFLLTGSGKTKIGDGVVDQSAMRMDSTDTGPIVQELWVTYTPEDPRTQQREEHLAVRTGPNRTPIVEFTASSGDVGAICQSGSCGSSLNGELAPGSLIDIGTTAATGALAVRLNWIFRVFSPAESKTDYARTNVCY